MEGSLGKETTMGKKELVHSRLGCCCYGCCGYKSGRL